MSEEEEIRKLVQEIQRASQETKLKFAPELARIRNQQRARALEQPERER